MPLPREVHPHRPRVLLCDADGTLFASEEPAFEASTSVTNRFLVRIGSTLRYEPDELRRQASGRNFRQIAGDLALDQGTAVPEEELEAWVDEELASVTAHLSDVLKPDPAVLEPLTELAAEMTVAVVSSSASSRLQVCLERTELAGLVDPAHVFSAADSLPEPTSKPDPAIYLEALNRLGVEAHDAVAVEDAVAGVASAVSAGIRTVGILQFVPDAERAGRATNLLDAGASDVVATWSELRALLRTAVAGQAP